MQRSLTIKGNELNGYTVIKVNNEDAELTLRFKTYDEAVGALKSIQEKEES